MYNSNFTSCKPVPLHRFWVLWGKRLLEAPKVRAKIIFQLSNWKGAFDSTDSLWGQKKWVMISRLGSPLEVRALRRLPQIHVWRSGAGANTADYFPKAIQFRVESSCFYLIKFINLKSKFTLTSCNIDYD